MEATSPKAFCGECGRQFSVEDLARFGDNYVCADCKPRFVQRMREGVNPIGVVRYGGFWRRAVALLLDGIICGAVTTPISMMMGLSASRMRPGEDPSVFLATFMATFGPVYLLMIGLVAAYHVFFVSQKGATPGKMVMGLKIVTATGGKVSVARAIARYFAQWLSSLILCIGYLMAAFDSEKRALHDHICSTRVIFKS